MRRTVLVHVRDLFPSGSDINILPFAGMGYVLTDGLYMLKPAHWIFLTDVPLDDEVASIIEKDAHVIGCIVPGIHSEHQRLFCQLFAEAYLFP